MSQPLSTVVAPHPLVDPEASAQAPVIGCETLVDAYGCDPALLRSEERLRRLVEEVIADLALKPLEGPSWHKFPEPGGVTGLILLTESHLTLHTFPESGVATFNLYCCRSRPAWPWDDRLRVSLGAQSVRVQSVRRGDRADICFI